jgi:hypothetical protein
MLYNTNTISLNLKNPKNFILDFGVWLRRQHRPRAAEHQATNSKQRFTKVERKGQENGE